MSPRHRREPAVRRSMMVGTTLLAAAALVAPTITATGANWNDVEWSHGLVGALDCETTTALQSRAEGRFLGANVLGVPLPHVADIKGVTVQQTPPDPAIVDPPSASQAVGQEGAWVNPLTVTLLNDALTLDLTDLLTIPVSADTGALNQYARTATTGSSTGASGLVNNSGGLVDLEGYDHPDDVPSAATLNLHNVVASVLGPGTADLVDTVSTLDLEVGAVGSRAQLDACEMLYGAALADALDRDYLIAGLDLDIASTLVGDLVTEVNNTVSSLTTTLNGLAGNGSLTSAVVSGLGDLLDGVLGTLDLGNVTTNLSADFDFSTVTALLSVTISDSSDLVRINLADGTIDVDIAKLFGGAQGLNTQQPNTELLINAAMINALTEAVAEALGEWVEDVTGALDAALDAVTLNGTVSVIVETVLGIDVISAGIVLTDASLGSLLNGTGTTPAVTVTASVLGIISCPPGVLDLVSQLVCPLATGIVNALTSGLPGVVGNAVNGLLTPLTTSLATTLGTLTATTTSPLIRLVAALVGGLFGVDGVASVLINAQNDPLSGGPEPGDWVPPQIPDGRYQVAALRIGVLGLLSPGNDLDVALAASSVGENGRP